LQAGEQGRIMMRFTLLLVPLCLLAAGCAGTAARGDDPQETEVQTLKARLLQLQQEAAMNQVELAQLRQKVAELESRNGGARPAAATPAPIRTEPIRTEQPKPVASRPAPVAAPPAAAPQTPAPAPSSPPPVRRAPVTA